MRSDISGIRNWLQGTLQRIRGAGTEFAPEQAASNAESAGRMDAPAEGSEAALAHSIVQRTYFAVPEIVPVTSYSHSVFRLRFADGERILKIGGSNATTALAKEALVLSLLCNQNVPAPNIEHSDFSGVQFQRPWLITHSLGDRNLAEFVADRDAALPELFFQMGSILARIHEFVPTSVRRAELVSSLQRDFTGQIEKLSWLANRFADLGIIQKDLVARFVKVQYPSPVGDRLCHGDYHPVQCVVTEGKIVGIVDWEQAWIGNPLFDLAVTVTYLEYYCPFPILSRFLEGYVSVRSIPADFAVTYLPIKMAHALGLMRVMFEQNLEKEGRRAGLFFDEYARKLKS